MREPPLVKVQVARGTQLAYDGRTYPSGAEVQAPEAIAERWIVRGWAEPQGVAGDDSSASKPSPRSRRTR